MKKLLAIVGTLLILMLPVLALAGPAPKKMLPRSKAGPPGGPPPMAAPIDPSMPGFGFDPSAMMMGMPGGWGPFMGGGLSGMVDARAGYMWMNLNANFPFTNLNRFLFEDMNITLKDANMWVGLLGLEIEPGDRLLFYGQIGASIPRDATAIISFNGIMNPFGGANVVPPWEWTASNLFWWMIDGGLGVRIADGYAIVGGFRAEHLEYRMIDPRNNTIENRGPASVVTNAIRCDRL